MQMTIDLCQVALMKRLENQAGNFLVVKDLCQVTLTKSGVIRGTEIRLPIFLLLTKGGPAIINVLTLLFAGLTIHVRSSRSDRGQ